MQAPANYPELERLTFERDGILLHAMAAGPKDGPPLLLLHGFPEFWYGWRKQMEPLAQAGFRVVAPDQRGYNRSSKPRAASAYTLSNLTADVVAIADQLGREQVCLAGHDWGAAVAWNTAIHHPRRIAKLAILNVPHPAVMIRFLKTRPAQMRRSWYILFFQIPAIPEWLFSARNFAAGAKALVGTSRPGTFSQEEIQQYREAWSQPGAVRGMINWYRAMRLFRTASVAGRVEVPTLILWGLRDAFLMADMAEESLRECAEGRLVTFENATHWLQYEEPEKVNQLLHDFFA